MKLKGRTLILKGRSIPEPPLETYRKFHELMELASSLIAETDTLAVAWATNPEFRVSVTEALSTYGFTTEEISKFTESELTTLILVDQDKPGILYQQNNAYPKFQTGI